MLLSNPEPAWLTPDTHRRFVQAKSSVKASADQAQVTHLWRQRNRVDSILERPPGPWYEFVSQHFRIRLVGITPQGDPCILVKMCDMKRLADAIRAGKGSLHDLEQHMAFINEYLYKVACPVPLPGGMGVQIIDCAGARLSMINSDTANAFKVFASFGMYYPERMAKAIVVNAPGWFDMPWRVAQGMLDENTRSKVVLEWDTRKLLGVLGDVLGPENVPLEYGGPCAAALEEYPEMLRLDAFVAELRSGARPYERVAAATPQP
ncbi:MAG: CRAL-TRIO domain-containing protein [Monoraphidium minutum]|nr:MAG: CRAL-TRIO domain-containing protein [Monoraphidium minutum]